MPESIMDRDLNLSNFRIKNIGTAIEPSDAISKRDLDLAKSKIFNYIESFVSGEGDPDPDLETRFTLAHPTDIYSALVFVDGVIKAPSSTNPVNSSFVTRDYQIITYATYSVIQFQSGLQNGANLLVLYNSIAN